MTMAELYAAPEKLDGGAAMVETIKAEVGKLNVESKEQREAKEKAARQEAEPGRNRNDSIGVGEDQGSNLSVSYLFCNR